MDFEQTFRINGQDVVLQKRTRPKYELEFDGETLKLCTVDQIHAVLALKGLVVSKVTLHSLIKLDNAEYRGIKISKISTIQESSALP